MKHLVLSAISITFLLLSLVCLYRQILAGDGYWVELILIMLAAFNFMFAFGHAVIFVKKVFKD